MPDQKTHLPPPGADESKAQRYVDTLADLLEKDKVNVTQTDLSRFNSVSMEDHYRINLHDYDVELSHNKNSDTGEETFIMIFNSINKFEVGNPKPVILAYMRLTSEQFMKLKQASDNQIELARKKAEEERFNQTMAPVDQLLSNLAGGQIKSSSVENSDDDPVIDKALEEMDKETEKSFDNMSSISEYHEEDKTPEPETPATNAPPIPDASWD
jgi:hypothetical protein